MPKGKNTDSVGRKKLTGIEKCPTGIRGLDEITYGGLPRGRPTLIAGGAGSGKTLMAMEFLVHGIRDFGEPGVFMAFEETAKDLVANVASLGFDLDEMIRRRQLDVDYVRVERSEIEETGEYDLEGLFVRLNSAIDAIGAKRVVLDTVESLFAGLPNEAILRAELRRLFGWLKQKGVTAVITGEQGESTLTRHGLEEYVSDCVIFLDHRVNNQIATRRLRVVKYRGSLHGTNEYPTMIDEHGLSVLPISSLGLDYGSTTERISTGVGPTRRHDGRLGLLPRQQRPDLRQCRHGQEQPGRRLYRQDVPPGRTLPVPGVRRSRLPRLSEICVPSALTSISGAARACSSSRPCARRSTAWSSTW